MTWSNFPLLCYFGHHKCASTWITQILTDVCREYGATFVVVEIPSDFSEDLGAFVAERRPDFLAYTDANIQYVRSLPPFRAFHVIRDPRDILVSAYFSHLYSHPTDKWPELALHRSKLQKVSKHEGLFLEMEFARQELFELESWDYGQRNVEEIRMEDLIAAPEAKFLEIFAFLGISLPLQRLSTIVWEHRFSKKSGGREVGQEDITQHYRRGVPGDWRNHLEPDHLAFFQENHGSLLRKLGYE